MTDEIVAFVIDGDELVGEGGFLAIRRLRMRNRRVDGSLSPPYLCDAIARPYGQDAVVFAIYARNAGGDRAGRYPEFIEHFHKLLARSQNALRGHWENLWASEQTCVVKLVDREEVIDKLVYTAANPVLDHLVDRVHHWPGVNGLTALLAGRPLRATRPLHFFRSEDSMPDALELPLTLPDELGPAAAVLSELRDRVRAVELERAARRAASSGGTSGPGSRREASGCASRRCCVIARSPASTPAPASDGKTAFPPCSRPAPTGFNGSHRCQCARPDLVRVAEHRTENRRTSRADTAWYWGAWSCPHIRSSTRDVLVDRDRGPSIPVGLLM
jgi:hypothetical protein